MVSDFAGTLLVAEMENSPELLMDALAAVGRLLQLGTVAHGDLKPEHFFVSNSRRYQQLTHPQSCQARHFADFMQHGRPFLFVPEWDTAFKPVKEAVTPGMPIITRTLHGPASSCTLVHMQAEAPHGAGS